MTPYRDSDHELRPGLLDGIPPMFRSQVEEPAFGDERGQFLATAVLWRRAGDDRWHAGQTIVFPPPQGPYDTDLDGSGMLGILFDDIVDRYAEFAADYYEIEVDRAAVGAHRRAPSAHRYRGAGAELQRHFDGATQRSRQDWIPSRDCVSVSTGRG
jgi:hypothetical protein